jgi:glycosyltransferase involved in cell wall biosynthesis
VSDRGAVLNRRRAAAAERRRIAEDRWRRFQAASSARPEGGTDRRLPERLTRLLARAKSPGRALLIAGAGVWRADLATGLGRAGGETSRLLAYVRAGPNVGVQPKALFDQAWYLESAPALAGSRWAPLAHYLVVGDLEGRWPHPLVEPRRVRRLGSGRTALQDFLFEGAASGRDPHRLFSLRHYVGQCEAVARTGENPLVHYLRAGWRDDLDPHPLFASAWVRSQGEPVAGAEIAPLLRHAADGGGPPSHPLLARRKNAPAFDPDFYLAQAPAEAQEDPLLHYLTVGTFEGLSPSPQFDEPAWFAANPGAATETRSGLELAVADSPIVVERTAPSRSRPTLELRPGSGPSDAVVTLVGYPFSPSGMGEHLRVTLRALQAVGIGVRLIDVADNRRLAERAWAPMAALLARGLGPLNLFCVNADEIGRVVDQLGRREFSTATNVIYTAWELARYPRPYAEAAGRFDEIWTPSTFVRDAIADAVDRSVFALPLAVAPEPPAPSDAPGRRHFGIPEASFAVLFFFDFASHATRKNPEGVLAAVELLAARRPEAPIRCVIKVRGAPASRTVRDAFEARVAALGARAQVLDGDLSDAELKGLILACDAFVSLHRSEGFGFGPAEAMALGRPVIATGYSGNLDFMPEGASLRVDYRLVPVPSGAYPHGEGQVWAEPSVEHASRLIEQLMDDPDGARRLAERGRAHIARTLSYEAVGARLAERLQVLAARRQKTGSSDR